jgi:phosphosulfolactate synthase (CoM biosynthesis protein A)
LFRFFVGHELIVGFVGHLLTHPNPVATIEKYLVKCKDLGFDVIELSKGFLSLPGDDWIRLVETVQSHNLEPKPELGIAFGAGGDMEGIKDTSVLRPAGLVTQAKRFVDMGVKKMMVESEEITENVGSSWRTDVVAKIARELPLETMMFEAADPKVFTWYVRGILQ